MITRSTGRNHEFHASWSPIGRRWGSGSTIADQCGCGRVGGNVGEEDGANLGQGQRAQRRRLGGTQERLGLERESTKGHGDARTPDSPFCAFKRRT